MELTIGIIALIVIFYVVKNFLEAQEKRLQKLSHHTHLYDSCVRKEKKVASEIRNKFKISGNEVNSMINTLQFRYNHLLALSELGQLPSEINHSSSQLRKDYDYILNLNRERLNLFRKYEDKFGRLKL